MRKIRPSRSSRLGPVGPAGGHGAQTRKGLPSEGSLACFGRTPSQSRSVENAWRPPTVPRILVSRELAGLDVEVVGSGRSELPGYLAVLYMLDSLSALGSLVGRARGLEARIAVYDRMLSTMENAMRQARAM